MRDLGTQDTEGDLGTKNVFLIIQNSGGIYIQIDQWLGSTLHTLVPLCHALLLMLAWGAKSGFSMGDNIMDSEYIMSDLFLYDSRENLRWSDGVSYYHWFAAKSHFDFWFGLYGWACDISTLTHIARGWHLCSPPIPLLVGCPLLVMRLTRRRSQVWSNCQASFHSRHLLLATHNLSLTAKKQH